MSYPTVGRFAKRYYSAYLPTFANGTVASVPVHARGRLAAVAAAAIGAMTVTNAVASFSVDGNTVTGLSSATTLTTATTGGILWDVEPTSPLNIVVNRGDTLDVTITTSGTTTTATVVWTVYEY